MIHNSPLTAPDLSQIEKDYFNHNLKLILASEGLNESNLSKEAFENIKQEVRSIKVRLPDNFLLLKKEQQNYTLIAGNFGESYNDLQPGVQAGAQIGSYLLDRDPHLAGLTKAGKVMNFVQQKKQQFSMSGIMINKTMDLSKLARDMSNRELRQMFQAAAAATGVNVGVGALICAAKAGGGGGFQSSNGFDLFGNRGMPTRKINDRENIEEDDDEFDGYKPSDETVQKGKRRENEDRENQESQQKQRTGQRSTAEARKGIGEATKAGLIGGGLVGGAGILSSFEGCSKNDELNTASQTPPEKNPDPMGFNFKQNWFDSNYFHYVQDQLFCLERLPDLALSFDYIVSSATHLPIFNLFNALVELLMRINFMLNDIGWCIAKIELSGLYASIHLPYL